MRRFVGARLRAIGSQQRAVGSSRAAAHPGSCRPGLSAAAPWRRVAALPLACCRRGITLVPIAATACRWAHCVSVAPVNGGAPTDTKEDASELAPPAAAAAAGPPLTLLDLAEQAALEMASPATVSAVLAGAGAAVTADSGSGTGGETAGRPGEEQAAPTAEENDRWLAAAQGRRAEWIPAPAAPWVPSDVAAAWMPLAAASWLQQALDVVAAECHAEIVAELRPVRGPLGRPQELSPDMLRIILPLAAAAFERVSTSPDGMAAFVKGSQALGQRAERRRGALSLCAAHRAALAWWVARDAPAVGAPGAATVLVSAAALQLLSGSPPLVAIAAVGDEAGGGGDPLGVAQGHAQPVRVAAADFAEAVDVLMTRATSPAGIRSLESGDEAAAVIRAVAMAFSSMTKPPSSRPEVGMLGAAAAAEEAVPLAVADIGSDVVPPGATPPHVSRLAAQMSVARQRATLAGHLALLRSVYVFCGPPFNYSQSHLANPVRVASALIAPHAHRLPPPRLTEFLLLWAHLSDADPALGASTLELLPAAVPAMAPRALADMCRALMVAKRNRLKRGLMQGDDATAAAVRRALAATVDALNSRVKSTDPVTGWRLPPGDARRIMQALSEFGVKRGGAAVALALTAEREGSSPLL